MTNTLNEAAADAREQLFGLTLFEIGKVAQAETEDELNRALAEALARDPKLAQLSQVAGGQWLIRQGRLAFVPNEGENAQADQGPAEQEHRKFGMTYAEALRLGVND